jgi:basic amino acid/polyamine antiporter, APA family
VENGKSSELVRAIGRWSLTALVINSIVGSGIFGLPSLAAGYVGRRSPLAFLLAAGVVAVIMACFAEVASRFGESGGPYLYTRVAFGRFIGIEIGWLTWLVRLTAGAAGADLFTNYLAEFWPDVSKPVIRLAVLTILIGFLAVVNYRGVKSGAAVSNAFAVAKLLPLFSFVIAGGIFLLHAHPAVRSATPSGAPVPTRNWIEVVLVLMFAYGGFEGAVVPMAEAKDPQRDAPFALGTALVTVAVIYCGIQYVVVATLPIAAATDRPLAVAARQMWGPPGAMLIAVGALISVYGNLSAHMLNSPRMTFALGERGDAPSIFSRIHPRFRTPHVSILFFAASVWGLAVLGNFKWNVLISSAGRLFGYGFVCAALPALRRKSPDAPAYRLPAGNFFAGLGIVLMLVLVSRMQLGGWIVILVTMAVAFVNWLWARNRAVESH